MTSADAQRPLRVAIVGSGPSGFYAAEALLRADRPVEVDMFDRLPMPYGLVRGGVAPDHQKIKSVTRAFERTASRPGFRFFGNVNVGEHLDAAELHTHYDQVVWAVGAEGHRSLGIPGEELPGSRNATEFVGWYNGHPDYVDARFDLSAVTSVVVIGVGNVAVDVARILVRDPEELAVTDIADHALRALRASAVREVWMLGRRGPAQAAFTAAEVRELAGLDGVDLEVRPQDAALDAVSESWLASLEPREQAPIRKNLELLADRVGAPMGHGRRIRLRLCVSPVEVQGAGGVTAVRVCDNVLVAGKDGSPRPRSIDDTWGIDCQLVLRAIGYRGKPMPGVPWDERTATIPNRAGRVVDGEGRAVRGAYAVGWVKRGPTGLIGTNRADARETVVAMLEDAPSAPAGVERSADAALAMIRAHQPDYVSFDAWRRLDALELERGAAMGKVRSKFVTVQAALAALLLGCVPNDANDAPEWFGEVEPVVHQRCAGCHQDGTFAPFSLTTYDEAKAVEALIGPAVSTGLMPPWKPADDCTTYVGDFSLDEAEQSLIVDWIEGGAVQGDPTLAEPFEPAQSSFEADVVLTLPEPYTPRISPDDYRCQILEWPVEEPVYVTGMQVLPDRREIVHHTIAFVVDGAAAEQFRQYDAGEDGPGYTCFGGPTAGGFPDLSDLSPSELIELFEQDGDLGFGGFSWLGSWAPGGRGYDFPAGTGILVEPDDLIVVQMHYNTLVEDPAPDRSSVELKIADSVERPAAVVPFTDIGWLTGNQWLGGAMDIPAGSPDTTHATSQELTSGFFADARATIGITTDDPLVVHSVALHMHNLGTEGRLEVLRGGSALDACLLHIDDWDFHWQGAYQLAEPVTMHPADELYLRCTWDNTAVNQPEVDGEPLEPRDVAWGDGTTDEMCLGILYVTAE